MTSADPGPLTTLVNDSLSDDISDALTLAQQLGEARPVPGDGRTLDLWEALSTIAAHDLGAVRAIEPHLDAVAILTQAGQPIEGGTWGVFAAEGGSDPLIATLTADGDVTLAGTKPWCSLADRLDHALVTANTAAGPRLFAVSLRGPGIDVDYGAWVARGLREIPSGPVHFRAVPARAIKDAGWYVERPGFAWGGVGVAACWFGGAIGIARSVHAAAAAKPNPHLLAHLGAIDEVVQSARAVLWEAAAATDRGDPRARVLAKRVRATVARACDDVIHRAGRALGPAPLALNAAHAKRVADLQLYVRQHHAERDLESLGRSIADEPAPW